MFNGKRRLRALLWGAVTAGIVPALWGAPGTALSFRRSPVSVRLCVSAPFSSPTLAVVAHGLYDAVQLAQTQNQQRFAHAGIRLASPVLLDDGDATNAGGHGVSVEREALNAKRCLAQSDTFAYIGPLNSIATFTSEPILNRGGLATISPANTNFDLTDPGHRAQQEPATHAGKIRYVTYYRTVSSDIIQGLGAVPFLKSRLHARTYFMVDDGSDYGLFLVSTMQRFAQRLNITHVGVAHLDMSNSTRSEKGASIIADQVAALDPDVVYCGCAPESAVPLVRAFTRRGFRGSILGADAILSAGWLRLVGPVARLFATNIGLPPASTAGWFRRAFLNRFQAAPQLYDAYAYDAAAIALQAIYAAVVHRQLHGSMFRKRTEVVANVAHACFQGATGTTRFDTNGDTENREVAVYTARRNSWQFAAASRVGKASTCH